MHKKYDFCIYFIYIHQVWQHQINVKLYGQIDINVQYQFNELTVDINFTLTVDVTKTFIFDLWLMLMCCHPSFRRQSYCFNTRQTIIIMKHTRKKVEH